MQVDPIAHSEHSSQAAVMPTPLCTSTPVKAATDSESETSDPSLSDNISSCDTSLSDSNPDTSESTLEDLGLPPIDVDVVVPPDSMNESTLSGVVPDACTIPQSVNAGFKIVFDNIDKTIKPRHMTEDSQSVSLHYVQAYAVKDRIDFSCIGTERNGECNLYDLLPNSDDYKLLKERFVVLVSRCITSHLAFFKHDFKNLVQPHIPHRYSAEMCTKSEVVSTV